MIAASPPSLILVGLGNPGLHFTTTRHNVGFYILDCLCTHYGAPPWKKEGRLHTVRWTCAHLPVVCLKPMTFMNLSGEPLSGYGATYPRNQWMVLHDDVDQSLGLLKFKKQGSAGGHRGLLSVNAHVGSDYGRWRVGVGRPEHPDQMPSYVLSSFSSAEQKVLEQLVHLFVGNFDVLCKRLQETDTAAWADTLQQWTCTLSQKKRLQEL